MPRKYARKAATRRPKKYTKRPARKVYRRRKTTISRNPLPQRMPIKFMYNDTFNIDCASGVQTVAAHMFRTNSLFDPDFTGTGHQPRGYDQIMTMYRNYTVIGFKAVVRFNYYSGPNMMVLCHFSRDTTVKSGNDYAESSYTRSKVLTDQRDTVSISCAINPNKFLGVTSPVGDTRVVGTTGTDPSNVCYLHVACYSATTQATDPSEIACNIYITYTAILTLPDQPAQS